MEYINILRNPDSVIVQTNEEWINLINSNSLTWKSKQIQVCLIEVGKEVSVNVVSTELSVKRVKLRWKQNLESGLRLLGDHWERGYGDLEWRGIVPERIMPWYFLSNGDGITHGYGVKTGPNAMCSWQVDSKGITLWLDVRCGGTGVELGSRELNAATIISREGIRGESAFKAAQNFCTALCERPKLPDHPIYGGNNWYYAYGDSSHDQIIEDTKLMTYLSEENENRPYMVIDDGWQICHNNSCNGGPWNSGNYRFPDMQGLAGKMSELGARPGIWFRPLLTSMTVPKEFTLPNSRLSSLHKNDWKDEYLDPSIQGVLELITLDVKRIVAWGYKLIKHDFSTYDLLGRWGFEMNGDITEDDWHFADKSKTTSEIILGLYRAIKDAAGDIPVIGCNTISHLAAGVFEIQRTGDDTSGLQWERTRKYGINTLAYRMPQHGNFYASDADCVGITDKIPWSLNKQWLDLLSNSGTPLFVSVAKKAIGAEQEKALKQAFKKSSKEMPIGEPLDWLNTTCPEKWLLNNEITEYDWFGKDIN
ncbi:MAG TPA: alpha-galactosidase [Clostridiaceae bacterium]